MPAVSGSGFGRGELEARADAVLDERLRKASSERVSGPSRCKCGAQGSPARTPRAGRTYVRSGSNARQLRWKPPRTAWILFFRFLVEEERLLRDPALPLRIPKKREVLPDVLTMDELERLLAATGRAELWERQFPGKPERVRLLLALMAYAGLRRSELLGLDWDAVPSGSMETAVWPAAG